MEVCADYPIKGFKNEINGYVKELHHMPEDAFRDDDPAEMSRYHERLLFQFVTILYHHQKNEVMQRQGFDGLLGLALIKHGWIIE
jgi:hypothetical protein